MKVREPGYDLRLCRREDVISLFEKFHGYKSLGRAFTYLFAVYEDDVPVAAYAWQPPRRDAHGPSVQKFHLAFSL